MQAVYFAVYMVEALIAYMYFFDNYKIKKSHLVSALISFALYALYFSVNLIWDNNIILNAAFGVIANIAFSLLCFEITLRSSIFHSAMLIAVMFMTELIPQVGLTLFGFPMDAYRNNITVLIIIALTSKTCYLLVCKLLSVFFSYKKSKTIQKSNSILILLPVIIIAMMGVQVNASYLYNYTKVLNVAISITGIVSLIFCCFIFIYNRYVQNQQTELDELKQERLKSDINMQYLNLLEQKNNEMRVFAHDIKNHLFAISQMSDNEDIKKYIDSISGEIQQSSKGCDSGNHTLDILLNKYITESERKGISFEYDVKLANLGFVEDYDLVTIIGNLLDNALEAAEQSAKKKITLNTAKVNTYDSLTVTNSCDTPPDKNLKTTKKNKQMHGLGIKSIQKAVKKYDGELEWEYDENGKQFSITIILLSKTV